MIQTVTKNELMLMTGLQKTQAQRLMRQAKALMVADGFDWYAGKRVTRVPIQAIERILGYKINTENDIIDSVQKVDTVIDKDNIQ
ncbi:DUF3173 domain-containing protein [Lactococcus cremoris]|uniref:DUF3173 family protein n=1 Tax=Lactococcus lactis subsp. cremoris TaxID=1359 RepID=A0AA34THA4_LACLC|nr:DUF3173 family protein [Lactococcus cremoris]ARE22316.1 DUF3173 family protein [Lactococcus cremoris]KZK50587.1 hypothetical protein SK110_0015 [Lactococcus cremoris]MCT4421257.1 DUF3173 domain-containing protein [Lactococcus cremoris]MCT4426743.1 DUF3173 domain-containing protein [Lactococcus cremoris]MDM7653250.1 DUF3173 family protein [Lactococcus cremoris]